MASEAEKELFAAMGRYIRQELEELKQLIKRLEDAGVSIKDTKQQ